MSSEGGSDAMLAPNLYDLQIKYKIDTPRTDTPPLTTPSTSPHTHGSTSLAPSRKGKGKGGRGEPTLSLEPRRPRRPLPP
jgi:hypothetical protein